MYQRKLPLVIHVDPMQVLSLNKTCRYCPHCDLLIAHQDDVEHFLAAFFGEQQPEVVGNDYLVLGTLDKPAWKQGTQQQMTLQEMLEALHDFKEVVTFKLTGGWVRDGTKPSEKPCAICFSPPGEAKRKRVKKKMFLRVYFYRKG